MTWHVGSFGGSVLFVDYVIRFEHYQEDFSVLLHAIGRPDAVVAAENNSTRVNNGINITQAVKIYNQNPSGMYNFTVFPGYDEDVLKILSSSSRSYQEFYTPEARDMVESHFEQDLRLFNYSF